MNVSSRIKKFKKKLGRKKMQEGTVRQKSFSSSLKAYYEASDEIKKIEDKIRETKRLLEEAREEGKNFNEIYPEEARERYLNDLNSNIAGMHDALNDLKKTKKNIEFQQKQLSKIINAAKKNKNTAIEMRTKEGWKRVKVNLKE